MRRSICYVEPNVAYAGDMANWKFIYTTAVTLPKGTKLRFDIDSKGRPFDWQPPQANAKAKNNLIWGELPGGKTVSPVEAPSEGPVPYYDFTLPVELKSGESFAIHLGSPDKDPTTHGNACQKNVQRRRPFQLHIDPKGKGDFKESDTFYLDVRGNKLSTLRILAPSLVSRNKRFDVIVRFEDIYGNLTSNAPEGTLIDLSYEHLRENLNWKLFVPETGFIALPNLYFNEPGLYKIQLKNLQTKETFLSSPIKCLPEGALNLYWGTLHGETPRFDSGENIENYLRYMRDEKGVQFVATSCFDSEQETSNDTWKLISQQVAEFNEEDRFVVILGFQWLGDVGEEGLRQFIYSKDSKPILRKKDTKSNSLKKIYKTNNPKELLTIPSFTMGKTTCYNFEDFNPEFERVVEIYNAWGSSECTAKEKNPKPIKGGKGGVSESAEGSVIKALNNGCRFGFTAGGFDDRGCYADLFASDQTQYTAGLTAILAKEQQRSSLFEALQSRSCYATTGEKIILGLFIAGSKMGSELDTKLKPGLEFNRHITGYVIGTNPLSEVALIRNGKVCKTFDLQEAELQIEYDDTELLSQIALSGKGDNLPFCYYYLRVTQKDGHMAWSSPIWIDISQGIAKKVKKK